LYFGLDVVVSIAFWYCDKHETKSQIGSQIERRLIRLYQSRLNVCYIFGRHARWRYWRYKINYALIWLSRAWMVLKILQT